MSRLLSLTAAALAATAGLAGLAAPAQAVEICRDVRVDLVRDWTVCVYADATTAPTATAGLYCDLGTNYCEHLKVTVG